MVNSGENIFSETPGNFHINFPGMFFSFLGGGGGVDRTYHLDTTTGYE